MKLEPIEYNGGVIWVDKEASIKIGNTILFIDFLGVLEYSNTEGYSVMNGGVGFDFYYDSDIQKSLKVVAQSPNLSIPNIPYVEVEEDVVQLAYDTLRPIYKGKEINNMEIAWDSFIVGYKLASAKKWSDEDMSKAFEAGRQFTDYCEPSAGDISFHWDDAWEYIQSLQPKIKSVEIEMITVDNSEWNDEHTICYRESDIEQPITYQKDGKTFLKVKKINYE